MLLLGKSLGHGSKGSSTCPVEDQTCPGNPASAGTSGSVVPVPPVPGGVEPRGASLNLPTPGGVWPWGPRGLTVFPGHPVAPPVDTGSSPAGPELPGNTDPSPDGAGNQVPDSNSVGGTPGVGAEMSLLAQLLNTLVQGLAPLTKAVASLKQSDGSGAPNSCGAAMGPGQPSPLLSPFCLGESCVVALAQVLLLTWFLCQQCLQMLSPCPWVSIFCHPPGKGFSGANL